MKNQNSISYKFRVHFKVWYNVKITTLCSELDAQSLASDFNKMLMNFILKMNLLRDVIWNLELDEKGF